MHRARRAVPVLIAVAVSLAACGSDDDATPVLEAYTPPSDDAGNDPASTASTTYPVTIEQCGETVTVNAPPERIVTLYEDLADPLIALGLGDRIVGTYFDFGASLRPDIRATMDDIVNLGADGEPSREAVLDLEPDFFFTNQLGFVDGRPTVDDFATLDTTIFFASVDCDVPNAGSIEAIVEDIRNLGIIFDIQPTAETLASEIEVRVAAVDARVADADPVDFIFWDAYEDERFFLLTDEVFHQQLAYRARGINVFPDFSYAAPISLERFAAADELDVVLVYDYGTTTENALPAFQDLLRDTPAGRNDRFELIEPRGIYTLVADLYDDIAAAIHPEAAD